MAFCGNCGSETSDAQKFCVKCGRPVGDSVASPASTSEPKKTEPDVVTVGSKDPDALVLTGKHLLWIFLGFVALVLIGFGIGGNLGKAEEPAKEEVAQSAAPKPAPKPAADTWENDISRQDCALISEQVIYLKSSISGESFNGSNSDLDSAITVFERVAGSYTGSDRDWLLKMAELSQTVKSASGTPVKQLNANLGLVDQFCGE